MIKINIKKDLRGLDVMEKQIPKRIYNTTKELADQIADIIHKSWSESAPSSPGNPPAVVTGKLDRSVRVERQGRSLEGRFTSGKDAAIWAVLIGEKYAATLEHGGGSILPRPFVLPAALQVADGLPDAYREVFNIRW